jgi:hypothetical protein
MKDKKQSEIWSILNKLRGKYELSIESIFNELERPLSFEELKSLSNKLGYRFPYFIPSQNLTNFFNDLFKLDDKKSIFDPWIYPGSLSHQIAEMKNCNLIGTQQNQMVLRQFNKYYSDINKKILLYNQENILEEFKGKKFDSIISLLPLNAKINKNEVLFNNKKIKIRRDLADFLILQSLGLLKDSGRGFFLVPNGFFFRTRNIINILKNNGYAINAILNLKSGTLPNTNIPSNLILIEKSEQKKVFIAQYTDNKKLQKHIIKKYYDKKEDNNIDTGIFFDLTDYKGFETLKLEQRIDKKITRLNFPHIYKLKEISREIIMGRMNYKFDEKENSIFIPLIGKSKVVSDIEDLKLKSQNYVQILLDSDKCDNNYLANFLNSRLGQDLLESQKIGSIPKINKLNLLNLEIPLPQNKVQKEVTNLQKKIAFLKRELDKSESKLWDEFNLDETKNEIDNLNKDPMDEWIKTLPNPLATLLLHYKRNKDTQKKYEFLFYFFEAYAELNFSVLFSLLKNNDDYYNKYKSDIFPKEDLKYLGRATFGNWLELCRKIAKFIRRKDKNDKRELLENINNIELEQISAFLSKDCFNILDKILVLRNAWRAHSGPIPAKKEKEILKNLEENMNNLLNKSSVTFFYCEFILGQSMSSKDGIFYNNVKSIRGATYPFEEKKVICNLPIDKDKIYLYIKDRDPIPIIPFIIMVPSSDKQKNICYFYNRTDKKGMRYVTYSLEDEPEIYKKFNLIKSIIKEKAGLI